MTSRVGRSSAGMTDICRPWLRQAEESPGLVRTGRDRFPVPASALGGANRFRPTPDCSDSYFRSASRSIPDVPLEVLIVRFSQDGNLLVSPNVFMPNTDLRSAPHRAVAACVRIAGSAGSGGLRVPIRGLVGLVSRSVSESSTGLMCLLRARCSAAWRRHGMTRPNQTCE
jgi:hypothetical protein